MGHRGAAAHAARDKAARLDSGAAVPHPGGYGRSRHLIGGRLLIEGMTNARHVSLYPYRVQVCNESQLLRHRHFDRRPLNCERNEVGLVSDPTLPGGR